MNKFNSTAWRRSAALLCGLAGLCLLAAADDPDVAAQTKSSQPQSNQPQANQPQANQPQANQAQANQPQANQAQSNQAKSNPPVYVVRVPLPIRGNVDQRMKRAIERALKDSTAGEHPLLILEFAGGDGNGRGSEFERSLSLARHLASGKLRHARTVAFVPESLYGHAVLPALACEEIIIARDAEFGAAGVDEETVDGAMLGAYQEIARRRRLMPELVVLAMLSKEIAAYKVETNDGVTYADREGLAELREKSTIREKTIVREGDLAILLGLDMRLEYGFANHLAKDRKQLAFALKLPASKLREDVSGDGEWVAVRVELRGRVTEKSVRDVQRKLESRLNTGDVNLVCLLIDSPGGSPIQSMILANYLADLQSDRVRTVAFVPDQARADSALPALACDRLIVGERAVLGGPGEHQPTEQERSDYLEPVQRIARIKARDWSPMLALADYQSTVHRYLLDGNGEPRILTVGEWESLEDPDRWERGEEYNIVNGISGAQAIELDLATDTAEDVDELMQVLQIDAFETVRSSHLVDAVERLATQPWFARTLLFIAFFAFISEASAPGLGAPGFVSLTCFLLFFWIQFFNGAADWLELILFVGGVGCLAVEILVIPGFGVFGIGGVLMVLSSILLASQTFVLPRNRYQYDQLPSSLLTVLTAMAGTLAAIWLMRHLLPHAPILNRLMLRTPPSDELHRRESLVDYEYLLNKPGTAATQLTPSGKAMFGDQILDVISRGEVIAEGARLVVSEVQGNRIVVQSVDGVA